MVQKAGARWEHSEGLVNYARAVEGVECGVFLSPARDGGTRVSLRSKDTIDAGAICGPLGGGGHPGAAGCLIEAPLAEARKVIVEALDRSAGKVKAARCGTGTVSSMLDWQAISHGLAPSKKGNQGRAPRLMAPLPAKVR